MKISNLYPDYAVLDRTQPELSSEETPSYYFGEPSTTVYQLRYTVEFTVTEEDLKKLLGD